MSVVAVALACVWHALQSIQLALFENLLVALLLLSLWAGHLLKVMKILLTRTSPSGVPCWNFVPMPR